MPKRKINSVKLSSWASSDLVDIAAYIEVSESGGSARRVTARILRGIQKLKRDAFLWRERDELFLGARILFVRPYAILYRIDGKNVIIVRIMHSRRDLDVLFIDEQSI